MFIMLIAAEDFIKKALEDYKFYGKDILFNRGEPLAESSEVKMARTVFGIPKDDNIYFAVTANTFGTWTGFTENSKGFAIATQGIYYKHNAKTRGLITFEEFYDLEITKSLSYVRIGRHEFNVGFPKKIADMLSDVQLEFALRKN